MTVDRCDFQIPPPVMGWYGIITETGNRAAFWDGRDWVPYPLRAYTGSMQAFATEAAALHWAASRVPGPIPENLPSEEAPVTGDMDTVCPFCGHQHNVASSVDDITGAVPEDDDITLCLSCGRFCLFDSEVDGGLRKPTKKEQRMLDRDDRMQEIIQAWKIVKRQ